MSIVVAGVLGRKGENNKIKKAHAMKTTESRKTAREAYWRMISLIRSEMLLVYSRQKDACASTARAAFVPGRNSERRRNDCY